jgi:hypothetical protein
LLVGEHFCPTFSAISSQWEEAEMYKWFSIFAFGKMPIFQRLGALRAATPTPSSTTNGEKTNFFGVMISLFQDKHLTLGR